MTVADRIVGLLETDGPLYTPDIADRLGVSHAVIRKTLHVMLRDGRVQVERPASATFWGLASARKKQ